VIGGAPCVDYSALNARREGVIGVQGSYMPRFGMLIQKIQHMQRNHHVFFLAENTILRNDKEENLKDGDLETIKESFGVQWAMDIDASYFSPGRRNRTYISNIPLLTKATDYISTEELIDCPYLTDDFVHCAHYVCDDTNQPRIPVKVACFLASKSRIDQHPTMTLIKTSTGEDNKSYVERRPFNIKEREMIMGLPVGYVDDAGMFECEILSLLQRLLSHYYFHCSVADLFQNLLQNGYGITRLEPFETYWKKRLPEKYHIFGGLPVRFYYCSTIGALCPKLQPPKVNTSAAFYNQEQYGKRLIGNAFSVPVLEILLRPLQTKFLLRQYQEYSYSYIWQTSRVQVKEEE
jgi:hypothetical protein